jgi:thymidylate kinase
MQALDKEIPESQPEAAATNGRADEQGARLLSPHERQESLGVRIAAAVFSELNAMEIEYVAISGYANYPDVVPSDVDIVIREEARPRLPTAMQRAAARCGARLISRLHYHYGMTYILTLQQNGAVGSLWCDTATEFRQAGRLWLRSEDLLQDRFMDSRGFYVAAPISRFVYHLIKKINKGKITSQAESELSVIYRECSAAAGAYLERVFSPRTASLLKEALVSGTWDKIRPEFTAIRREMHQHAALDGLQPRAHYLLMEGVRKVSRICAPTGICVAFMGPDGSGKSSVIEQYLAALGPAFRQSACFHLRPHLLRGSAAAQAVNTDPQGQTPRGTSASLAKLLFLWVDYVLGYYLSVRPRLMRSTLVVFDRYYHDLLIDAVRFRYGGPRWLARLVAELIPMPDLIFFLDAPAGVLQARKQEVSREESARQAESYRVIANSAVLRGRGVLVDAARALDKVVDECADRTLALMEMRTARRLHLN